MVSLFYFYFSQLFYKLLGHVLQRKRKESDPVCIKICTCIDYFYGSCLLCRVLLKNLLPIVILQSVFTHMQTCQVVQFYHARCMRDDQKVLSPCTLGMTKSRNCAIIS